MLCRFFANFERGITTMTQMNIDVQIPDLNEGNSEHTDKPENIETFCSICQLSTNTEFHQLECGHTFHRLCLYEYLHFDKRRCPNCNQEFSLSFVQPIMWSVKNLGLSIESNFTQAQKLRQQWSIIKLRVFPPPNIYINKIRFFLHPAFSKSCVELTEHPFEIHVQLFNNDVFVVLEITFNGNNVFILAHRLMKEIQQRNYFFGQFNGVQIDSDDERMTNISRKV
ncbi:MAG: hypothetical protein EZS28_002700 [Streblomastix strix]|uniref:RING-type domain-containing protein n=1 Tax=Streblomastix strix TaxID=222440 RepID=A0A5J4X3J4_9EUKA|nr:MAG: hypothetical protein EZS28_002700 [Streblomastix strix]